MVDIRPFRGFNPTTELAKQVASPPYDVLNRKEAKNLAQNNPYSFLHVVKAEIDLADEVDEHAPDVYKKASANFQKLISESVLKRAEQPSFYIYRLIMNHMSQIGIVAGTSVKEYEDGIIKKHEHTREKKELDRVNHFDAVNAQTGPVFLTYRNKKSIDKLIQKIASEKPTIDFKADDGIQHTLWFVEQTDEVQAIINEFNKIDYLYVADGHHRSAAATRICQQRRAKQTVELNGDSYEYFLSVIFPDNQLNIMDYNRVLKTLNGHTEEEILAFIDEKFYVTKHLTNDLITVKPSARGEISMYLGNNWYQLRIKDQLIPQNDPVNSLDVAILQNEILQPLFGIDNPRVNEEIDFIGGIRGLKELVKRCQEDGKIAFAMYPTGIDQLMEIADANQVMPPKSTWFEPKLRSGLVVKPFPEKE